MATAFKLLQKSFTEKEWRQLIGTPAFIGLLADKNWTEKDLEQIIDSGFLFLKRNEDLNPAHALRIDSHVINMSEGGHERDGKSSQSSGGK